MELMNIAGWMVLGGVLSWLIFHGPTVAAAIRMTRKSTVMARKSGDLSREASAAFKEATEKLKEACHLEKTARTVYEQVPAFQELVIELRAKIDFAKERMPSLRDEWLALSEEDRAACKVKAEKALFGEKDPN